TDEEHVARRRKDAVAVGEFVGHVLLPLDLVRGGVDGNDAARLVFADRPQTVARFRERMRRGDVSVAGANESDTVTEGVVIPIRAAAVAGNRQNGNIPVRGIPA